MTTSILFVCLGNICRSPATQGVVRARAPALTVDSAGTADWHVGTAPYGPMQTAARARDIDLSDLRARQLTPDDFARFDLIIGMDADNLRDIEQLRPPGNQTPVRLFTDHIPHSGADHVPDPFFTRDFDGALDLIEQAAQGLIDSL